MSKLDTLIKLYKAKKYKVIKDKILDFIPRILVLDSMSYRSALVLLKGYGHSKSFRFNIDEAEAIPWMTYPFLDYMKNLDLSKKSVFEYGSGLSTIFWAKESKIVTSIEDNEEWYKLLSTKVPENTNLLFKSTKEDFINAIKEKDEKYDLIILDGNGLRYECALVAINYMKAGGMIVLDDSDNIAYNKISDFLKSKGLIQIDFIGFKPGSTKVLCTSIYIDNKFNFKQKYKIQPKIFTDTQREYIA